MMKRIGFLLAGTLIPVLAGCEQPRRAPLEMEPVEFMPSRLKAAGHVVPYKPRATFYDVAPGAYYPVLRADQPEGLLLVGPFADMEAAKVSRSNFHRQFELCVQGDRPIHLISASPFIVPPENKPESKESPWRIVKSEADIIEQFIVASNDRPLWPGDNSLLNPNFVRIEPQGLLSDLRYESLPASLLQQRIDTLTAWRTSVEGQRPQNPYMNQVNTDDRLGFWSYNIHNHERPVGEVVYGFCIPRPFNASEVEGDRVVLTVRGFEYPRVEVSVVGKDEGASWDQLLVAPFDPQSGIWYNAARYEGAFPVVEMATFSEKDRDHSDLTIATSRIDNYSRSVQIQATYEGEYNRIALEAVRYVTDSLVFRDISTRKPTTLVEGSKRPVPFAVSPKLDSGQRATREAYRTERDERVEKEAREMIVGEWGASGEGWGATLELFSDSTCSYTWANDGLQWNGTYEFDYPSKSVIIQLADKQHYRWNDYSSVTAPVELYSDVPTLRLFTTVLSKQ